MFQSDSNRRSLIFLAVVALAQPVVSWAKIDVVATTSDLGAIAKAVGGSDIRLTVLAKPTEDAHFVDPRPSFIVKLNRADVLIEGGADLEIGWLGRLVTSARNSKILPGGKGRLEASHGITLMGIPDQLDRSQGDVHAAGNPHYLMNPENARIVARSLAEAFCEAEPKSCDNFKRRMAQFVRALDEHVVRWKALMAPHAGSRLVAYHDTWPYFAQEFGLVIDLFMEPKPGIPPTAAHLSQLIDQMKRANVGVILREPHQSRRTAEKVARSTGATVVDVAHFPGAIRGTQGDYIATMDALVQSIAKALARQSP